MSDTLLAARGLVKHFGGLYAADGVDLCVMRNQVHALIGPNGAGKTTFVGLLTGELSADAGSVIFNGLNITRYPPPSRARLGIARSFQITSVFAEMTALENVSLAVQISTGHSLRFWRRTASDERLRRPAEDILETVGLGRRGHDAAASLSHGEHRQLELALALAGRPKLLLLDEPLAGMSRDESQRMTTLLRSLKGRITMLLIEHDIGAVFELADTLSVLVRGRVIAAGHPDAVRDNPSVQHAYLGDHAVRR